MTKIASVWTAFGLTGDPYFQDPLSADAAKGSARSTALFVGREREVALLGGHVVGTAADGSSRSVVQGAAGVGKTSFVNRLKAVLADPASTEVPVLTHAQAVRVTADMSPRAFAADVLRTLLLIRIAQGDRDEPASAEQFWRRMGRVLHGEDTTAVGASIGTIGGSIAPGRIAAEDREGTLFDDVMQAFALLSHHGTRRIVVHVNNLENLSPSATDHAERLVQNLRDYFLIPYSHWIFVGATGIDAAVFRRVPQVGGIMPPAVTLDPLTEAQVTELLERRYHALQRGIDLVIPPVAPDAVSALYQRYRGDLRNFLRILSNGVRHAALTSATSLQESDVIRAMTPEYFRALIECVGSEDATRLATVARVGGASATFRVADLATANALTADVASRLMDRLQAADLVVLDRTEGRSVYYRLRGDVGVAFGL